MNHISRKASAFYFGFTNLIIRTVKIFQSKIIKDNPKNKSGSVFFVKKNVLVFQLSRSKIVIFPYKGGFRSLRERNR